jgi:uncharacterized protein (TIGR02646 family)
MRRLQRPFVLLPTLRPGGKGATQADFYVAHRLDAPPPERKFPSHWNEPDVRGALYSFHGRACAYCQCALPANDPGDVEHFRPKAIYWWLAYEFQNYLLSCARCNRVYKKEHFPLPDGMTHCTYENRHEVDRQTFLLLDPVGDSVEDWLFFNFEDPICPGMPTAGLPDEQRLRVDRTIAFFRLNENVRLQRSRYETVNQAMELLDSVRNGDEGKKEDLQRMASRFAPFGIAVRQMLIRRAPDLLPQADEELRGLMADIFLDLREASDQLRRNPGSRENRRLRRESCWALAVLWRHPPPPIPPEFVESCLEVAGWKDAVNPYYAQI